MTTQPETALDKFLKSHRRTCTVFVFSGDRHCSCGRDEAEKQLLKERAERMEQLSFFVVPVMEMEGK